MSFRTCLLSAYWVIIIGRPGVVGEIWPNCGPFHTLPRWAAQILSILGRGLSRSYLGGGVHCTHCKRFRRILNEILVKFHLYAFQCASKQRVTF
jgi:hypothetical protein